MSLFTKSLDFVVSNPSPESYLPRDGDNRYQGRRKRAEYLGVDENVTPFAVEITGRIGDQARVLIEFLEQEPEMLKNGCGNPRVSRLATLYCKDNQLDCKLLI